MGASHHGSAKLLGIKNELCIVAVLSKHNFEFRRCLVTNGGKADMLAEIMVRDHGPAEHARTERVTRSQVIDLLKTIELELADRSKAPAKFLSAASASRDELNKQAFFERPFNWDLFGNKERRHEQKFTVETVTLLSKACERLSEGKDHGSFNSGAA